jgi:hypothetical protein
MSQPKQASGALGAQDALADIDMELLQDAVQRDELADSVQNVRRFQDDARKQTLDGQARPDYRAIAGRQFQINEMLLTLLQELATRQRGLELELRLAPPRGVPVAGPGAAPVRDSAASVGTDGGSSSGLSSGLGDDFGDDLDPARPPSEALVRRLDTIQAAMRDDALALQLEVTPTETPVVGRLLGNLRTAVHSLVVFYGNQLAARQTEVNRVYGGALQQMMLEHERERARSTAAQAELTAELADLRVRLEALESR